MTLKQIRSQIRSQLVRITQNTDNLTEQGQFTDSEIDLYINEASRIFCEETGLLATSATVTVTDGVGDVPTGFLAAKRVEIGDEPIGRLNRIGFSKDLPV